MVAATHPIRAGESETFEGETDPSGVPGRPDRYRVEVPIFATVRDAVRETGANASIIFVPAPFAADAIMEAANAGLDLIVAITEHIPVLDMVRGEALPGGEGQPTRRPKLPGGDHTTPV